MNSDNDVTKWLNTEETEETGETDFLLKEIKKDKRYKKNKEDVQIAIPFSIEEFELLSKEKDSIGKYIKSILRNKTNAFKRKKSFIINANDIKKIKDAKKIIIYITKEEFKNLEGNCGVFPKGIFLKYLILTETNLLQ